MTGDIDYDRYYNDMADAEHEYAMFRHDEMEESQCIALRRLRLIEKKLGLPHHEVIFEPGRKIYDEKGNLLEGQIPKPGERFYEKIDGKLVEVKRKDDVIYVYTGEAGMPLVKSTGHEGVEKREDMRDRPAVAALNRSYKRLYDLVEEAVKRQDLPSDFVRLAVAKRDEAERDIRTVGEEIYKEREKLVEVLVSILIKDMPITIAEEYEKGAELFKQIYLMHDMKRKLTKKEEELLSQYIADCMTDYEYPE